MSSDWIHTRRGARLCDGTLPSLARGIDALVVELKRYNDVAEARAKRAADREAAIRRHNEETAPKNSTPCSPLIILKEPS